MGTLKSIILLVVNFDHKPPSVISTSSTFKFLSSNTLSHSILHYLPSSYSVVIYFPPSNQSTFLPLFTNIYQRQPPLSTFLPYSTIIYCLFELLICRVVGIIQYPTVEGASRCQSLTGQLDIAPML